MIILLIVWEHLILKINCRLRTLTQLIYLQMSVNYFSKITIQINKMVCDAIMHNQSWTWDNLADHKMKINELISIIYIHITIAQANVLLIQMRIGAASQVNNQQMSTCNNIQQIMMIFFFLNCNINNVLQLCHIHTMSKMQIQSINIWATCEWINCWVPRFAISLISAQQ